MNMVKSPQSSVQPVELEFALCTVACHLFNFGGKVPIGWSPPFPWWKQSMLDYGEDHQQDAVQTHRGEVAGELAWTQCDFFSLLPCMKLNFKRELTWFNLFQPSLSHGT